MRKTGKFLAIILLLLPNIAVAQQRLPQFEIEEAYRAAKRLAQ